MTNNRQNTYEKINIIRKLHEHEDILINHRMTWMSTLQAFLFTAIMVVLSTKDAGFITLMIFPIILSLVGLISCASVKKSIKCSNEAIENIRLISRSLKFEFTQAIFGSQFNDNADHLYKAIVGTSANPKYGDLMPWRCLPRVFMIVWSIFLCFFLLRCLLYIFCKWDDIPKLIHSDLCPFLREVDIPFFFF